MGMRHLVDPVTHRTSLPSLREKLQAAHDYLCDSAKKTAAILPQIAIEAWATAAKRTMVNLEGPKPELVNQAVGVQSFVEIVNQCATLERLVDALRWAESEQSGLRGYEVALCHPTTSSGTAENDHDLVLIGPSKELAKFEVSDVASEKDGNGKEVKDLVSLGCLSESRDEPGQWPTGRMFLVVSPEFAKRLMRSRRRHGIGRGTFHYVEHNVADRDTRILEVVGGPTGGTERE